MVEIDGEFFHPLDYDATCEFVIQALNILSETIYDNTKREIESPGLGTTIINCYELINATLRITQIPLYKIAYPVHLNSGSMVTLDGNPISWGIPKELKIDRD